MKKIILFLIPLSVFVNPVYALELTVTSYTVSISGVFHEVTVALSDLNKSARVRCVIFKNKKPVGMTTELIYGVGSMTITFTNGITGEGLSASCQLV
jgi:hypothetical protein